MSLTAILSRIAAAEAAHSRAPGSVTLVAVSKVQPDDRVRAVLTLGHRVFGENYVQEAAAKWPAFRAEFPGVQLHMIGPLQTNKAKQAMDLFDTIQSLDRPSLAQKLASLAQTRGTCPQLFVQVNTGSEPQKAGVLPGDLDALLPRCRAMDLTPRGLMCIPPEGAGPHPSFCRPAPAWPPATACRAVDGDEQRFRSWPSPMAPPMSGSALPFSAPANLTRRTTT